ncbi:hypothetical protein RF11_14808 [Thelohanellus kitauei]|uniref:Uncharacterized protein n=1 Tax=Thelohanellus kitauei TaxID=669202 RepID=A0A0C2MRY5_THEKT|nr:hypothetical protein RF11_14808 [Thelohanellus kitauei]
MNRSNIDAWDLMCKANILMEKNQFKEAADTYYESAEIATAQEIRSDFIKERYEDAAKCYLKTKDVRAYECYNKVVDVNVKNGQINRAIQKCFEYGYLLFVELKEEGLYEKLYRKGEDLRLLHDLQHSCVITKFDVPVIEENDEKTLQQAVSDAVDLRKKVIDHLIKFQVKELVNGKRVITHECMIVFNLKRYAEIAFRLEPTLMNSSKRKHHEK